MSLNRRIAGSELQQRFEKVIDDVAKPGTDWETCGKEFMDILTASPDFYPARFNYAVSLLHQKRLDEAEPILLKLVNKHPDYLFAKASLVQLYLQTGRPTQASELIQTTALPEETHPTAMAQWMAAQALFHADQEDYKSARRCIESAHNIAPENQVVSKIHRHITSF